MLLHWVYLKLWFWLVIHFNGSQENKCGCTLNLCLPTLKVKVVSFLWNNWSVKTGPWRYSDSCVDWFCIISYYKVLLLLSWRHLNQPNTIRPSFKPDSTPPAHVIGEGLLYHTSFISCSGWPGVSVTGGGGIISTSWCSGVLMTSPLNGRCLCLSSHMKCVCVRECVIQRLCNFLTTPAIYCSRSSTTSHQSRSRCMQALSCLHGTRPTTWLLCTNTFWQ